MWELAGWKLSLRGREWGGLSVLGGVNGKITRSGGRIWVRHAFNGKQTRSLKMIGALARFVLTRHELVI